MRKFHPVGSGGQSLSISINQHVSVQGINNAVTLVEHVRQKGGGRKVGLMVIFQYEWCCFCVAFFV